jgi:hypothetical protein
VGEGLALVGLDDCHVVGVAGSEDDEGQVNMHDVVQLQATVYSWGGYAVLSRYIEHYFIRWVIN